LPKCLVYRDNKLDLEVRAISRWLELREFFATDEVQTKRIAAGEFDLPWQTAQAERDAAAHAVDAGSAASDQLKRAAQMRDPASPEYATRVQSTGYAAQLSSYSAAVEVKTAVEDLTKTQLTFEAPTASGSASSAEAGVRHLSGLRDSADIRYKYYVQDVAFRKELNDIKRDTAIKKAIASASLGNGLNYKL
jgi:hypothetical protein